MTNPRHMHEFIPNRRGGCKQIVGGMYCSLREDAPVHQRWKEAFPEPGNSGLTKVWLVYRSTSDQYGTEELVGVFSTEELAEQASEMSGQQTRYESREVQS